MGRDHTKEPLGQLAFHIRHLQARCEMAAIFTSQTVTDRVVEELYVSYRCKNRGFRHGILDTSLIPHCGVQLLSASLPPLKPWVTSGRPSPTHSHTPALLCTWLSESVTDGYHSGPLVMFFPGATPWSELLCFFLESSMVKHVCINTTIRHGGGHHT